MNCNKTKTLLDAWRDGELDEGLADQMKEHFDDCAVCQTEHQSLQRMSLALRRDFHAELPEDSTERAFRAAMTSEMDAPSFLKALFPIAWPTAVASSVAAVFLVGWSLSSGPSVQITDAELFDRILGTSSTEEQVNGIVQEVLGVDASSSGGVK